MQRHKSIQLIRLEQYYGTAHVISTRNKRILSFLSIRLNFESVGELIRQVEAG